MATSCLSYGHVDPHGSGCGGGEEVALRVRDLIRQSCLWKCWLLTASLNTCITRGILQPMRVLRFLGTISHSSRAPSISVAHAHILVPTYGQGQVCPLGGMVCIHIWAASPKHRACNRPGRPFCDKACNRIGGSCCKPSLRQAY